MIQTMKIKTFALSVALFSVLSCDEEEQDIAEGTLTVEIWGEEFIEEGIPADEFADGYALVFSKFLVTVSDISVAQQNKEPALTASEMKVWDVVKKGPATIESSTAKAGDYTVSAYRISPATEKAFSGNASSDDVDMMIEKGLSVYVEGTASKENNTLSFAWGFSTDTVYDPCHSIGQLMPQGKATVQLTIHGDHLFYDSATSEEPALVFNDIALADGDNDGVITEEELLAYDITALPIYNVGNLKIDNLYDYIDHMTSTLGHIDGEEHCEIK